MGYLTLLLILVPLYFVSNTAYKVAVHYQQARCLGVPILVSPVATGNPLWLAFQDKLVPYISRLPFGLGYWVRYNRRAWFWMFKDRGRIHQEYGPIVAHVNPKEIHIWVSDKDVVNELLKGKNRGAFDKPRSQVKVVDFLSPHLMTACGDEWKHHRRIVASPFNQRSNRIVWTESVSQGLKLGQHWLKSSNNVRSIWKDNETATMNVILSAGFGMPDTHKDFVDEDRYETLGLHSSLAYMLHVGFIWIVVIPSKYWFPKKISPWLPKGIQKFLKAVDAFKTHIGRMVTEAKATASQPVSDSIDVSGHASKLKSDNLLASLVRHSEEVKQGKHSDSATGVSYKDSLSDDEIISNLFGLAFAGHETTAHTLSYVLTSLSIHPDAQDWMVQEIRQVLKECNASSVEALILDDAYPRLVRTRAVIYETLRLYTPLANIFKQSLSSQVNTIEIGSRTIQIPPNAYVLPSLYAIHVLEEYWGKDSLEWKPQRWISIDSQGKEEFVQPSPAGTFLPWSDGPRSCPGARFAQTELVAMTAALISNYALSVARKDDEDEGAAVSRVKAALDDSTIVFTLIVKEPEKLPLRIGRRESLR